MKRKALAVAEYPYAFFAAFLRAADRVRGVGDLACCLELGRVAAQKDIQSVYNLDKKRASPDDLVRDSQVLWKSYYVNAGRMKTEDLGPEHCLIRIYDFGAMDPAHCRLTEGWMNQAVAETGGLWLEELHEVKCMSAGDPDHEFVGKWRRPEISGAGSAGNGRTRFGL